jgi:hypothetical protein
MAEVSFDPEQAGRIDLSRQSSDFTTEILESSPKGRFYRVYFM